MSLEFSSVILVGGGSGTGFAKLPKNTYFERKDKLLVRITGPVQSMDFFAQTIFYAGSKGFFVPKRITEKFNILNETCAFKVSKTAKTKFSLCRDGRIYLPHDFVRQNSIKQNSIVLITIKTIEETIKKYAVVRYRKKKNSEEFFCMSGCAGKNSIIDINMEKIKKRHFSNHLLRNFLKNLEYSIISTDSAIIFDGAKKYSFINPKIKLSEIAYYLGCYFADGTKKGNSWGICASTPEQAAFYYGINHKLILDPNLNFEIVYTVDNSIKNHSKNTILKKWQNNLAFDISKAKIRIINNGTKNQLKRNKFGTLVFKDHRKILLDYYNYLLNSLISRILNKKDKKLAADFILGVLEGDGTVNAKKRGHIQIVSNEQEYKTLQKILSAANFNYATVIEKKRPKFYLRIGALELLLHFPEIQEKVFQFYPKRRQALAERISATGAARFIAGKQGFAVNWVKAYLKNNGVLNVKGALTQKGEQIKQNLTKLIGDFKQVKNPAITVE